MSDEDKSGNSSNDEQVTMTKEEHNALQGRLRLFEKQDKERKAASKKAQVDAERKAAEDRLKAAQEAGTEKELRQAEEARDKAQRRLSQVLTDNAIRDAAGQRMWSQSAQRTAAKMVDTDALERDDEGVPTPDSIKSVLDGLEKEYPDIYFASGKSTGDKGGQRKTATTTPSTPAGGTERNAHFKGYISEEQYLQTPFDERQSPEFRKRLEQSRVHWPKTFNHHELGQQ